MDEAESSTSSEKKKMEAKDKGPLEEQSLITPRKEDEEQNAETKRGIIFQDTYRSKDEFGLGPPIGRCTVINSLVYAGVRFPHNKAGEIDVPDPTIAIKYVNLEQNPDAVLRLRSLADRMNNLNPAHRNLMGISHSFTDKGNFIVVFPLMEKGSLRSIMAAKYPNGFPELCILILLREVLTGLYVIHENGHLHREINAGHIFLNAKGEIKLAYSASVYEQGIRQRPVEDSYLPAVSICNWASAPEVHGSQNNPYTTSSDIWMVGITALELAYGGLRIESRRALNSMVEMINRKKRLPEKEVQEEVGPRSSSFSFRRLLGFKKRDFSKKFGKMVAKCLNPDPDGRPTANVLLRSKIFRRLNKGPDYFYDLIKN